MEIILVILGFCIWKIHKIRKERAEEPMWENLCREMERQKKEEEQLKNSWVIDRDEF